MMYQQFTDPAVEVQGVATSHRSLIEHLKSVGDVDPAKPTGLDGWTIGHLLTHLARNADSHRALLAGEAQYDDWDSRDHLIQAGAGRGSTALVLDLATASALLDQVYNEELDWDRDVAMLAGRQRAGFLPLARRREVEVHRVDLCLGYDLEDVAIDFVTRDVRLLEAWWIAKNRAEASGLPSAIASRGTRDRWSWLVGRRAFGAVPPAVLF